jgi:hypothetical protein
MPRSRGILLLGSQEVRITAGYSRARPSPPTLLHKNTYVCFYRTLTATYRYVLSGDPLEYKDVDIFL